MNCPVCNAPDCVEVAEEVDIGVGNLRQVIGYECKVCGLIPVCQACGGVFGAHRLECGLIKELLNEPPDDGPDTKPF